MSIFEREYKLEIIRQDEYTILYHMTKGEFHVERSCHKETPMEIVMDLMHSALNQRLQESKPLPIPTSTRDDFPIYNMTFQNSFESTHPLTYRVVYD